MSIIEGQVTAVESTGSGYGQNKDQTRWSVTVKPRQGDPMTLAFFAPVQPVQLGVFGEFEYTETKRDRRIYHNAKQWKAVGPTEAPEIIQDARSAPQAPYDRQSSIERQVAAKIAARLAIRANEVKPEDKLAAAFDFYFNHVLEKIQD